MQDISIEELKERFKASDPAIQNLISGGEVNKSAATLGKLYNLPVALYLPLKNTITYILLGVIEPEYAAEVLKKTLNLSDEQSQNLAHDLDGSIFQKARISIVGNITGEIKNITVGEEISPEDLRKEILDTTKRTSAIDVSPVVPTAPRPIKVITPGSRSQLLEQLNVLGQIPDDEEIAARLAHIQEQIKSSTQEEDSAPSVAPSAEQKLTEQEGVIATPQPQAASYSKAPTKYNIDPYREIAS